MFTPKIETPQTVLLAKAILSLETQEEANRFLEDVLTAQELLSIAQRIEVALMLKNKNTYYDVGKKTGASTATISRVNRCLQYGARGYETVLERMREE